MNARITRRQLGRGALGLGLTAPARPAFSLEPSRLGMVLTDTHRQAGLDLLARYPSVDLHSHAGRFFLKDAPATAPLAKTMGAPFTDTVIADAMEGQVSAILFSAVSDFVVLDATPSGLSAVRPLDPQEALRDYERQIGAMAALTGPGRLAQARSAADVKRIQREHRTGCIFSVEGGDFIGDRLDRIARAWRRGVRSITVIHYRTNQIGDPQTSPPTHHGLSPLGKRVIREMNRVGVIVDLSHASLDATRQAAEVSSRPMMFSHSNLKPVGVEHPRLISLDHARLVSANGGVVGALPGGAGIETLADFIQMLLRMVDRLGVDHVGVGTDMDFTFRSVIPTYRDWGLIASGLLAMGMRDHEAAKLLGGNFLRVLAAHQAAG